LALVLDTAVQALFRAEDDHVELPGRAIPPEEYRGILLNRQNDAPLDGLEELIVALNDIGEILERPALARLARIARAAEKAGDPAGLPSCKCQHLRDSYPMPAWSQRPRFAQRAGSLPRLYVS